MALAEGVLRIRTAAGAQSVMFPASAKIIEGTPGAVLLEVSATLDTDGDSFLSFEADGVRNRVHTRFVQSVCRDGLIVWPASE